MNASLRSSSKPFPLSSKHWSHSRRRQLILTVCGMDHANASCSPEGLVRRLDLIRQTLRYGDWSDKFSLAYLAARLRDIIEVLAIEGADQAPSCTRCKT